MNLTELKKERNKINNLISRQQVVDALQRLERLNAIYPYIEFTSQIEKLKDIYHSMLTFTFSGTEDPKRQEVYNKLIRDLFYLNDVMHQYFKLKISDFKELKIKEQFDKGALTAEDVKRFIEELAISFELRELLKQSDLELSQEQKLQKLAFEESISMAFKRLWLKDRYTEIEETLIKEIIANKDIPWYVKTLLVSAITLSLTSCYQSLKIELLIGFITEREENVWERALVGLILALNYHAPRLKWYKEDKLKIQAILDNQIRELSLHVFKQLIKSEETEKISEQLETEIIPEIIKQAPKLTEKLSMDELLKWDQSDEENPDWKKLFEDNEELYNKIEKLSEMQLQGADVFMTTFSRLKNFDFFQEMINWFLPFFPENEHIRSVSEKLDKEVLEAIHFAPFICNSDKYSFILNLARLPQEQISMVSHMFVEEINTLKADLPITTDTEKSKFRITQYMQDLYRFFRLFPYRFHFDDIVNVHVPLTENPLLDWLEFQVNDLDQFANLYFQFKQYDKAIPLFEAVIDKSEPDEELFQKTAFSYQKIGQYENALKHYLKAEIINASSLWNLKKIAYCYKKTGKYQEAIEYYHQAIQLSPDNIQLETQLAQCYLELEDYPNALKHFFKVEYLTPDKENIIRPIAWSYLHTGKLQNAINYYQKLDVDKRTAYDWLHMGHAYWGMQNPAEAASHYIKAYEKMNYNTRTFITEFFRDKELLKKIGIPSQDLPLMADYIRMKSVD